MVSARNSDSTWLGTSEMAERIRTHDWSNNALGPLERWPQSLRMALGIGLNLRSPVAVYWGNELIVLYNDAAMRVLGDKHPGALGRPAREVFTEIWSTFGPGIQTTLQQGVPAGSRHQPLPLNRDGRLEDCGFEFTASPIPNDHGEIGGVLVTGFEVTDHVRATEALQFSEQRLRMLVAELQHRTRNLLAVVRVIAAQTFSHGGEDDSLQSFQERLGSLGRVQGLISRAEGERVKLLDIVRAELEAYDTGYGSRLEIHGPEVRLSSNQVQTVALALHELVTNAVKYGALKVPTGMLSVTWETWLGANGRPRLVLMWRESGVPMPPDAAARRGHGRELIENALRFSLRAETQLVFSADGVWCRIELPVDHSSPSALDPGRTPQSD